MPCLPAFQTNHHFHMRLKFGATFWLQVDSVTPSAPYSLLRAHIYFLPGSQTITPTKSGAMRICTCEWIFFGSEDLLPQGREATKAGWPQWNCSPATEVTQGFHAGSLLLSTPFILPPPPPPFLSRFSMKTFHPFFLRCQDFRCDSFSFYISQCITTRQMSKTICWYSTTENLLQNSVF